jgi:hypothetical protein
MKKYYLVYWTLINLFIFICPFDLISQNNYTVRVIQPDAVQAPIIYMVTVNSVNKNQLMWSITPNENISYFKIYRDNISTSLSWDYLGKVIYKGELLFTDNISFPGIRSYQYKISVVDKCGNEIFCTNNVRSINLSVKETNNSFNLLKWNAYVGFNVEKYIILRGAQPINMEPIDTIDFTQTTYIDNQKITGNVFYQVEAISTIDNNSPTLKNIVTHSNITSNKSIINFDYIGDTSKIQIYPNPLTINALVVFPYEAGQINQLSIIDLSGKTVYTKSVFSGEVEIDRKNLNKGFYILQIIGKKIYRKKLIVENI